MNKVEREPVAVPIGEQEAMKAKLDAADAGNLKELGYGE